MVRKGIILTIEGNTARVAPVDDMDAVSGFYTIPPHLRVDGYEKTADAAADEQLAAALREIAEERRIRKGDTVAFAGFSDCSGVILAKMTEA